MCFNCSNWRSEPCQLGKARLSRESPLYKNEFIATCLNDSQAPPFLPTNSAHGVNPPGYTDRELVENYGLAAGLTLVESLGKNGIITDSEVTAAFSGAAIIVPELQRDGKQTDQLPDFRPRAVHRPDMEPVYYREQLNEQISFSNAESHRGNADSHTTQLRSIGATRDWTSYADEVMQDADSQLPYTSFFDDAIFDDAMLDTDDQPPSPRYFDPSLGIDTVGVSCISPERPVLRPDTSRFEVDAPNITITQPSAQAPGLTRGVIERGMLALLHLVKWSKTFYDCFREITERSERNAPHLDILEHLHDIFPNHREWRTRGQHVWEKVAKGDKVDTLPDILAFASLSYVISIVRAELGQIQHSQPLSDLHGVQNFITNVNEREVFTFLVGQMGLGVCESAGEKPIGLNLAETPADCLLQDHARNGPDLQTQYDPGFAQVCEDGQSRPASLSLRNTPSFINIRAFFNKSEGFFFALSGRGKTLARGWETPRTISSKAAKTLGKEFFGPLKKSLRDRLETAGTRCSKFCALLAVSKRLVVLGYLRTRMEVTEYLITLSMELLEPLREQPDFASLIRGDDPTNDITRDGSSVHDTLAEDTLNDDIAGDDAHPSAPFVHRSLAMHPKGRETVNEVNVDPPAKKSRKHSTLLTRRATAPVKVTNRVNNIRARHPNPGKSSTNLSTISKQKMKDCGRDISCEYPGCDYRSYRRDQTRRHFGATHKGEPLPPHLEAGGRGPTLKSSNYKRGG